MEGEVVTAITKTNTLRDYLRVLFRHKAVIITTFVTIITAVFIGSQLQTPYYTAQSMMFVTAKKRVESPYYKQMPEKPAEVIRAQSLIALSNPVMERTVRTLHLDQRPLDYEKQFSSKLKAALIDYRLRKLKAKVEAMTPEQKKEFLFRMAVKNLKENIETKMILQTGLFTIKVKDFDPEEAARIANTVSRAYVIFDLEMQLTEFQLRFGEKHSSSVQLKDNIEMMKKRLNGELLSNELEAIGPGSVKIVEQAITPRSPSTMNKPLMFALSFMLSGVLGVLFAFGFDRLEQTFKSPQDVEKYLNVPFLGSIPKRKPKDKLLIDDANPDSTRYVQSFQDLSGQIGLLMRDRNLKSILIIDAEGSGENAAVIANLGIYSSRKAGYKVLIIDADLRSPSISGLFDISNKPGLVDVLEGKVSFKDAVRHIGHNLYVLPSNKTAFNPLTLVGSSMMSDVIRKAGEEYEITFIACADLRHYTDAVILSSIVDGTVLIVNEGGVKRQVVMNAIAPLAQKKANLLGVVLNNRVYEIPDVIYKLT
ncbi:tyrosine-protein kinase YwqD [bacterium BMS3Abin06]|nr:tyrosine-protein kinase YwqD [bacterium BMS3Abin06]